MMKKKQRKNSKLNSYILLHGLLIVYSFSSVLSKLAANEEFLSFKFCLCYGGIIIESFKSIPFLFGQIKALAFSSS